jgi:hypothetical protein
MITYWNSIPSQPDIDPSHLPGKTMMWLNEVAEVFGFGMVSINGIVFYAMLYDDIEELLVR